VLQYVAVCCSVVQCGAVCCGVCSVLQCGAVWCSVLQYVAVCPSKIWLVRAEILMCGDLCCVLQCVAVCCSVLQCVAVCCSVSVKDMASSRSDTQGCCRRQSIYSVLSLSLFLFLSFLHFPCFSLSPFPSISFCPPLSHSNC